MLAYLFWHRIEDRGDRFTYEALMRTFHARLLSAGIEGFERSGSFRVDGLPWIGDGGDAYEDWYVLKGSAALDKLNEAAVSGERRGVHDDLAYHAVGGAGGLYRLRHGDPAWKTGVAHWFSKPQGLSYAEVDERLRPLFSRTVATLWQRQLTLGPANEYCLIADAHLDLGSLAPTVTLREAL